MDRSPDSVRLQIDTARRKNLKAFKLCADPWWMDDLAHNGRLLLDPREEAGPDARIIVDAQLAYRTAEEGLSLIPLLLEAGVWFLEAPLSLDDYPGPRPHGRPRIDLGVGDLGLTHVLEFIEIMDHGGADICQPDISQVGGFTGILIIAAAAGDRHKRVITHGYKTKVEIAANLNFLAAHPEEDLLEYSLSSSPCAGRPPSSTSHRVRWLRPRSQGPQPRRQPRSLHRREVSLAPTAALRSTESSSASPATPASPSASPRVSR